jgi:hypothetical protein
MDDLLLALAAFSGRRASRRGRAAAARGCGFDKLGQRRSPLWRLGTNIEHNCGFVKKFVCFSE